MNEYKLAKRKSPKTISMTKKKYSLLVRGVGKSPKIDFNDYFSGLVIIMKAYL